MEEGLVPLTIDDEEYFYDPEMKKWHDSEGDPEFYISFNLGNRQVHFDAKQKRFYNEDFKAFCNDECAEIEQDIKRIYDLNGKIRFFHP